MRPTIIKKEMNVSITEEDIKKIFGNCNCKNCNSQSKNPDRICSIGEKPIYIEVIDDKTVGIYYKPFKNACQIRASEPNIRALIKRILEYIENIKYERLAGKQETNMSKLLEAELYKLKQIGYETRFQKTRKDKGIKRK